MTIKSVGFIGGGRVVRIILEGWQRAGCLPRTVEVSEPDATARERLESRFAGLVATAADPESAARQDLVVLAVHPPALEAVLDVVRPRLRPDAIVLSLAPKVGIADMKESLGGFSRIARMIPNAGSVVGAGYNPIAFSLSLDEARCQEVLKLFEPLGECPPVAEEELEAYAIVSAMGPTYLWFQLATLKELGEQFGLSSGDAARAVLKMTEGTAAALFSAGLAPEEVMDLVPVRPLAGHQEAIDGAYRSVLPALYEKLRRPAPARGRHEPART